MKLLRQIIEAISFWIDSVAATINSIFERTRSHRRVRFVENEHDIFTLHLADGGKNSNLPDQRVQISNGSIVETLPPKWLSILRGSRIELVLQSSRFLFRPLELPKRAAEYLDGIVRSQIDRLTPWTANEAIFSWTQPTDAPNDRINLTIAATAQSMIAPYLRAVAGFNAASIVVSTAQSNLGPQAAPIRLLDQRVGSAVSVRRTLSILMAIFLLSGLSAAASIGFSAIASDNLGAEQQELMRKISARKAAMRNLFDGSALHTLEKRKQTTPSSVITLEALSKLLPDDTYVTELRIDGERLQIVGMTSDAPSLIRLIEQSPHFARAIFFAPTTRSPGTTKEQFHIESHINPIFTFGS
ncbi:MAG: PilN domain-containing protein [Pseudolabrys sp.]